MPKLSVILPVYNAGKYLASSIHSVLQQSYTDFEFLIFNDGSEDNSDSIIRSFNDKRIRYFSIPHNVGYVELLNRGLKISKGEFIARMDADDICFPQRFSVQLNFLEANPNVGICGTWCEFIGDLDIINERPVTFESVKDSLFYGCPLTHPTVMMRKECLIKNNLFYDKNFMYAEDHDLFWRGSFYFDIVNIPEVLLKYRIHNEQIGSSKWMQQYQAKSRIQAKIFSKVLLNCKDTDLKWMTTFFTEDSIPTAKWEGEIHDYKLRVIQGNAIIHVYQNESLVRAANDLFAVKRKRNIKNYFLKNYYNRTEFTPALLISFINENM